MSGASIVPARVLAALLVVGLFGGRFALACPGESGTDCLAPGAAAGSCDDGCDGAGGGAGPAPGSGAGSGAGGGPLAPAPKLRGPNTHGNFASGSPVTGRNGRYLYQHTDLQVDSPGLPFAFTRYYNSRRFVKGPFGWGWSHSYHWPLTVNSNGSISILNPRLETLEFLPETGGTYRLVHPSLGYELTTSTAGTFVLKKDKLTYEFNASRQLTTISDAFGHTTSLTYSTVTSDAQWGPVLSTLTDSVSRTYSVTWTQDDAHSLEGFTLPAGPHHSLTKLTENATGRTITYDLGGELTLSVAMDSALGDSLEGPQVGLVYAYSLTNPSYNLLYVVDRALRIESQLTYDDADGVATYKCRGRAEPPDSPDGSSGPGDPVGV